MYKECTIYEKATGTIFYGQIDTELENLDEYPFREATQEEINANSNLKIELKSNIDAKKYLTDTDWKVIRHRDQLALGITTTLSQTEYENLLEERQKNRNKVI
jgi:hypothetical protein